MTGSTTRAGISGAFPRAALPRGTGASYSIGDSAQGRADSSETKRNCKSAWRAGEKSPQVARGRTEARRTAGVAGLDWARDASGTASETTCRRIATTTARAWVATERLVRSTKPPHPEPTSTTVHLRGTFHPCRHSLQLQTAEPHPAIGETERVRRMFGEFAEFEEDLTRYSAGDSEVMR